MDHILRIKHRMHSLMTWNSSLYCDESISYRFYFIAYGFNTIRISFPNNLESEQAIFFSIFGHLGDENSYLYYMYGIFGRDA